MSKQRDVRWCVFRYSIAILIGYLSNACIDMVISTSSCSYCIWNRYWQNHRRILPNFQLFAWFDTLEFNRLPCSNNKIYDDADFADRFCNQFLYVWNSSIDMAILTPSCTYCIYNRWCQNHCSILPNFLLFAWFDTIEFNRMLCSNNKMHDDIVFNDRFWYQMTMFEVCIFTGLSRLLDTHIAYEIAI